jgi:hypothetical protein
MNGGSFVLSSSFPLGSFLGFCNMQIKQVQLSFSIPLISVGGRSVSVLFWIIGYEYTW